MTRHTGLTAAVPRRFGLVLLAALAIAAATFVGARPAIAQSPGTATLTIEGRNVAVPRDQVSWRRRWGGPVLVVGVRPLFYAPRYYYAPRPRFVYYAPVRYRYVAPVRYRCGLVIVGYRPSGRPIYRERCW
jgi:hypothetical protein